MASTPDILLNAIKFADQYPTIQAAVNDAGKLGAVLIPPDYPGADKYANPNGIVILDLRPGKFLVDVPHGERAVNYPWVPAYGGLGLTMAAPRPLILSAAPMLTTPLGWFASSAILN